MRVKEPEYETIDRDKVLCTLKEAVADAETLIESLRDELEEAYERMEDLEDQVAAFIYEPLSEESQEQRVLPDVSEIRENYPLWDGLMAYFPAALCEVARWSKVGNDKHNPGEPLHWSREKSTDHKNKIIRHLLDAEKKVDGDFYEATALAWRSLALLQELLEKDGWPEGENARRKNAG